MKNIQILLVLFTILNAQTTTEGFPASMLQNTTNQISTINMPEFDIDAMLLEDSQSDPGTPFRYGKIFSVDYNLNNSGTWEILDNGDKLWRLKINSKFRKSIPIEQIYAQMKECITLLEGFSVDPGILSRERGMPGGVGPGVVPSPITLIPSIKVLARFIPPKSQTQFLSSRSPSK